MATAQPLEGEQRAHINIDLWNWGSREWRQSYSRMSREDDLVICDHGDYDQEDDRRYEHRIEIPLEVFRQYIQTVQTAGSVKVNDKEKWTLSLRLVEEEGVRVVKGSFWSESSERTAGGTPVYQTIPFNVPLALMLDAVK